jgi:hypothetical protein
MTSHVKVLGAIFLLLGAFGVIGGVLASAAFGLLTGIAGAAAEDPLGPAILGLTGLALTAILLVLSVPSVICGWGLLKFRPWARILAIVLAAISLVFFPYGTIVGVYALWVLLRKDTESVFEGAPGGAP